MPSQRQMANLRPIKRGEVKNPSGRNQYSYRQDFEEAIGRLAAGRYQGRTQGCTNELLECSFCGLPACELLAVASRRVRHRDLRIRS